MTSIKATEMHLFIGLKVRVVYTVDRGLQGMVNIVDSLITDDVLLQSYNQNTQEVTIQRTNGNVEKIKPIQVFAV